MNLEEDLHIIQKVLEGDNNAFGVLVNKYKNLVFTLCVKMIQDKDLAEDVAQDSFVKAFQKLSKFNGKSKFSSWLYRITYNNCVDAIKKNQKIQTSEIDENTVGESLTGDITKKEKEKFIKEALLQLPEQDRAILTLYYYQDESVSDIAKSVGISESNVKIKLHRSRKVLKSVFEKHKELLDI